MTKFEAQARSFRTKFAYEEVTFIVEEEDEEEKNKPKQVSISYLTSISS